MTFAQRRTVSGIFWYALLVIVALLVLFPLWSAFTISQLTDAEVASYPPLLRPDAADAGQLQERA